MHVTKLQTIMDFMLGEIELMISLNMTYSEISSVLRRTRRGFSARSVRRFCRRQGISRQTYALDRLITACIQLVGHSYGRRSMQGILRSMGIVYIVLVNRVAGQASATRHHEDS